MLAGAPELSGKHRVDLVFTDVLLPGGGSGLDLAREIARRELNVPVVLTSDYGGGVTARLAAANLPILRKPYRIEALKATIDEALHMRVHASHEQPAGALRNLLNDRVASPDRHRGY